MRIRDHNNVVVAKSSEYKSDRDNYNATRDGVALIGSREHFTFNICYLRLQRLSRAFEPPNIRSKALQEDILMLRQSRHFQGPCPLYDRLMT